VIEEEEDEDIEKHLVSLWKLMTKEKEANLVNRWYGAIYEATGKKKAQLILFVGKALHRFRDDADGPVSGCELDCLVPPVGNTCVLNLN